MPRLNMVLSVWVLGLARHQRARQSYLGGEREDAAVEVEERRQADTSRGHGTCGLQCLGVRPRGDFSAARKTAPSQLLNMAL